MDQDAGGHRDLHLGQHTHADGDQGGTGGGTVTSAPAGIDCGSTCSATFPAGTMVTLTATAGRRLDLRGLERRLQRHRHLHGDA